jgi:hypothetical protein
VNALNDIVIRFGDGKEVGLAAATTEKVMEDQWQIFGVPLTVEIAKLAVALAKKKKARGCGIEPDVARAEKLLMESALAARRIERLKLPPPTMEELKEWRYYTSEEGNAAVLNSVSSWGYLAPLYWCEARRTTKHRRGTRSELFVAVRSEG